MGICTGFYVCLWMNCVYMFCVSVYNRSEQKGQEKLPLTAELHDSWLNTEEGKEITLLVTLDCLLIIS